jgi:hypothetical protein
MPFVDNMKKTKYSKTVKDWFVNFTFCYGKPAVKDEAESFYNAGFDDGAGCMCSAMREAGVPLDKIIEVYSKFDPKGESITHGMIMEDWVDEDCVA